MQTMNKSISATIDFRHDNSTREYHFNNDKCVLMHKQENICIYFRIKHTKNGDAVFRDHKYCWEKTMLFNVDYFQLFILL